MKKKEVLIIFVLAVLLTGVIPFFQGVRLGYGWPLVFVWLAFPLPLRWTPLNLLLDFLFWFLVLASGWLTVRKMKKLFSTKQAGFTPIEILVVLAFLATAIAGGVIVWQKKS